jgi:hypothetical protein
MEQTSDLLYELVDEVNIDVDRFRAGKGESPDALFLTGIEFAVGAAGFLATAFVRGFIKGLRSEARAVGLDPEELGERAGRRTFRAVYNRAEELGKRAGQILAGSKLREAEEDQLGVALTEMMVDLDTRDAAMPQELRDAAGLTGRAEITEILLENGFAAEAARDLSERLAARLESVRPVSAET